VLSFDNNIQRKWRKPPKVFLRLLVFMQDEKTDENAASLEELPQPHPASGSDDGDRKMEKHVCWDMRPPEVVEEVVDC
jgi:hypothetical protein